MSSITPVFPCYAKFATMEECLKYLEKRSDTEEKLQKLQLGNEIYLIGAEVTTGQSFELFEGRKIQLMPTQELMEQSMKGFF